MHRTDFLKILDICKPALSSQDFIPVLTNFCFTDGGTVYAYNDVIGIETDCDIGFVGGIKGVLLLQLLSKSKAKELHFIDDSGTLKIKAARSEFEFQHIPEEDFIFDYPDFDDTPSIQVTEELLEGITRCLIAASDNPMLPTRAGITLIPGDQGLTLYATDGFSMASYLCDDDVTGFDHVIFPNQFCQQLIRLGKMHKEGGTVYIGKRSVLADFGGTTLFSKLLTTEDPLDFEKVFGNHWEDAEGKMMSLPKTFHLGLDRACTILSSDTNAIDKLTKLEVEDGILMLVTKTEHGKVEDTFDLPKTKRHLVKTTNPSYLLRAIPYVSQISFGPESIVMSDEEEKFVYMTTYIVAGD